MPKDDYQAMTTLSNRLVHGGLTAAIGRSAVAVGAVLVNALIARMLSPEETGLFLIALSMVTVTTVLADFGLSKTLLRVVPDAMVHGDSGRAMSHIRHVFVVGGWSGILVAALLASPAGVFLAGKLSHGELLGSLMPLVALWLIVTLLIFLLAETCRAFHHIGLAILLGGVLTGLGNILLIGAMLSAAWLLSVPVDLEGVLWMFILSGLILAAMALARLRARFKVWGESVTGSLSALFSMAWPFWLSNAAMILLMHAEIAILGYLRSPEEVASYGLVARLAILVSFPLLIANSVLPPLISELHASRDIDRMERMLRGVAGLTTLLSLVLFIGLLLFGEPLSGLLFGSYYSGNWNILMILASGWLFHVWAGSGGFVLSMTDNQHTMMRITLIVGTLTVLAGIWLTIRYGGLGMAIATSAGLIVQNILMLWFIDKHIGIRIHASLHEVRKIWREVIQRLLGKQGRAS
jgi:O-antigen/teichoic acid export membrane protein